MLNCLEHKIEETPKPLNANTTYVSLGGRVPRRHICHLDHRRKTVDTEYTYYSWCMTSTDIVKWRKTNDYENFEKGMIYMKILKKGVSREKGGVGNEIHAPCACGLDNTMLINWKRLQYIVYWLKEKHKICHFDRWSSKLTLKMWRHFHDVIMTL